MKTIGAKELRLHLDEVIDRVLQGEDIVVAHRFKRPVRLSAYQEQSVTESLSGLAAFDAAPKKVSPFDIDASLKELYAESLTKKYLQ